MAENKKYWEAEKPKETSLGGNVFKSYRKAGKLQVYRAKEGSKFGVTKGCTIELDQMSEDELAKLAEVVHDAITAELDNRGMGEDEEEEEKPKKKTKKTPKDSKKKVVKKKSA